jgi:hypothetical protein
MRPYLAAMTLFLVSCASTSPRPSLPVGEFYDQVLDPLAGKIADERIDHELAGMQQNGSSLGTIGSLINAPIAILGAGLDFWRQASTQEKRAALESRRLPLKKELLALFESRTKETADGYSVCVEGIERRYSVKGERFVREANGSGPCESALIYTLPPKL